MLSSISNVNSEKKAIREYQFAARKRLYDQFEPLSFQLVESSEIAMRRIRSLAKESRDPQRGEIKNSDPRLYMINTMYRILVPLDIFRIIQRRLTSADLFLDRSVNDRYRLGKVLYISFTHGIRLYESYPFKNFKPIINSELRYKKRHSPDKNELQSLYYQSSIDKMADALIVKESNNTLHIMRFNEFESSYYDNRVNNSFDKLKQHLIDFHPHTNPVLWRVLILQFHIYKSLKDIHKRRLDSTHSYNPLFKKLSKKEREDLNWWPLDEKSDKE